VAQRLQGVLAADAGLLHAAERDLDRRQIVGVDPAGAGLQCADDAMRAWKVACEDAGSQPELGVLARATT
jgi:hypothetical protein